MEKIIEVKEEIKIGDIILEKGDKIQVLKESHFKQIQGEFFDLATEAYEKGGQEYVIDEFQELFEFCKTRSEYAGLQELEIVFSNMLEMIYSGKI